MTNATPSRYWEPLGRYADDQHFDQPEHDRADDGAGDVADPAEHRGDERLDAGIRPISGSTFGYLIAYRTPATAASTSRGRT